MEKKRIFIYARRSTTKNANSSISIDKQIEILTQIAEKNNVEIVSIFKDNCSSFVEGKRDEFTNMLFELEKRNIKGKGEYVDEIYVYMASRLCRNIAEAGIITSLIDREFLSIFSFTENYGNSLSEQKRLVNDLTQAVYESKEKSKERKINADVTLKQGRLTFKPAYGYILTGRGDTLKLELDTIEKANEAVRKVFDLYSTGLYKYKSLADKINELGYRKYKYVKKGSEKVLTRNLFNYKNIELILTNPFYYGKIAVEYKNLKKYEREHFENNYPLIPIKDNSIEIDYTDIFFKKGTLPRIIDRNLFVKCENIRKGIKSIHSTSNRGDNKYLWKGLIRFDNSNLYTSEIKKGQVYYKINTPGNSQNTNEKIINNIIKENILDFIKIDDKLLKEINLNIVEGLTNLGKIRQIEHNSVENDILDLENELMTLFNNYKKEDNEYIKDMFKKDIDIKSKKLKELKENLETNKNRIEGDNDVDKGRLNELFALSKRISENLLDIDKEKQIKLLKVIFEYIIIQDRQIIDFKLKPLFEAIYNNKVRFSNKKKLNNSILKSNSDFGLKQTKKTQSENCVLYGIPDKNRTYV